MKLQSKSVRYGMGLALVTACISGLSIFYNKTLVVSGLDPLVFNLIKNGGVALLLTSFLVIQGGAKRLAYLRFPQWLQLVSIGIIGGSIPFVLFFAALSHMPALQATLIHKTLFVWVALLAVPLLKEKLSRSQLIGYGLVLGSSLLIGGLPRFSGSIWELAVFAATLLWALENIIVKYTLRSIDTALVAWSRMFFGSAVLLLISLWQGKTMLMFAVSPQQLLIVFGSILFLTGYVVSWYAALKYAPATLTSSILVLATPITAALQIFTTFSISPELIISNGIIILGMILIVGNVAVFPKAKFVTARS